MAKKNAKTKVNTSKSRKFGLLDMSYALPYDTYFNDHIFSRGDYDLTNKVVAGRKYKSRIEFKVNAFDALKDGFGLEFEGKKCDITTCYEYATRIYDDKEYACLIPSATGRQFKPSYTDKKSEKLNFYYMSGKTDALEIQAGHRNRQFAVYVDRRSPALVLVPDVICPEDKTTCC